MDSLMDALTNVVGILLLILIVSSLGISAAVRKVVDNLPKVTEEELEAMKSSRDKTLENLEELRQTHSKTVASLPTDEEAKNLVAELEELEENNEELADKVSDIEEWKQKVEEQQEKKDENEKDVTEADQRNRELAALLAENPAPPKKKPKEIAMPNPRRADPESRALYLVCKFDKLYFVGDPYDHAFKIRDVIDQNFSDLAYTGKAIGSYDYPLRDTRKDDRGNYIPLEETFRLTSRDRDDLAAWDQLKPTWTNRQGEPANKASILDRIFGSDEEAELDISKFRYDFKKISNFFGDGKYGPQNFKYHISQSGDRIKMALEMKEEGGWTSDQFLSADSQFERYCKQASTSRRVVFYYYVSPDSFETYLQARAKSEQFRVPAGWSIWEAEKLEPRAIPPRESTEYDLDTIPDEEYMNLAESAGPAMVQALEEEQQNFTQRVEAAVPEELEGKPEERADFVKRLTEQRRTWNATRFQPWTLGVFKTALTAQEASGETEVAIQIHPPEIPHIRTFRPSKPPEKPPPPKDDKPKPKPKPNQKSGPGPLILD